MGQSERKKSFIARHWWIIPVAVVLILAVVFFTYTGIYYRADEIAAEAMRSDEVVTVRETDFGYLFDGPSDDSALIFYPGGKVEESAYAPLLHELAAAGVDVCLVKMPFRLAIFDANAASDVISSTSYEHYYLGGHSLGGAMAARYAASEGSIEGLFLLAAYPTLDLPATLPVVSIVGSSDTVVDREKMEAGRAYVAGEYREYVIEGGNHALFGSYGAQKGDGSPTITAAEQGARTVEIIMESLSKGE